MGRFPGTGPPGSRQSWAALKTTHLAPKHSLFQDRKRDWAWATALHTRPQDTGLERTVLGGRREYWGTHRPGGGGSAGLFISEGARCPPSPGHLRGGGLGAWRAMRGGVPRKYFYIFPQLSSKGTQSYPARPWGQPRLEVQRAAPWGGGEGRGGEGLNRVSIRPWRTCQVQGFSSHLQAPSLTGGSVCPCG